MAEISLTENPDSSTCWRRLRDWHEAGVFKDMWRAFLSELDERGYSRLGGVFRGCNLHPGKKRGAAVGKTKRGKGTKRLVVVDGQGIPLGSHTDSASPAEIRLLEKVMADVRVPKKGPRQTQDATKSE